MKEYFELSVFEISRVDCMGLLGGELPYFFGYKIFFSFQNNHKNLDLSYKMDLDLLDCLGMVISYYSKISKD